MTRRSGRLPCLLVLASTYPRWAGDPEPGFVHELSRRLADRFRVIVLCPHAEGALTRETLEGVEVVRYRYAPERLETLVNDGGIVNNLRRNAWKHLLIPGFVLAQAWQAMRLVRREQVDVIHAHWLIPQGIVAALLSRLPGRRPSFVITCHGSDVKAIRGVLMDALKRWVLGSKVVVTTVSESLRDELRQLGGQDLDVRVQPMGVDLTERFVPKDVPRDRQEILSVGRLVPGKGTEHLIRALPRILERLPEARLTIVGQGPAEASLRELAVELGVTHRVTFTGAIAQEQLPNFYRRAGVFVAGFDRDEGFGLVLVEAIGCGCPVLANDVPAARYILDSESSRLTVDCADTDALADRIVASVVSSSSMPYEEQSMRASVRDRFDWRPVADTYAEILSVAAAEKARNDTV